MIIATVTTNLISSTLDVRALKERGQGHIVRVKLSTNSNTHEWQRLTLNIVILLHFLSVISLHTRSMSETICDAPGSLLHSK